MEVDEAPGGVQPSALPEEDVGEDLKIRGYSMALEGDGRPVETDQMAEGSGAGGLAEPEPGSTRPVAAGRGLEAGGGGPAGRVVPSEPWSTHDFSCSLCKRLFSSLEHLREHEYRHALSLMAMSLDWRSAQDPYNNNHHHHHHSARPRPPPPPPPLPLCRPSASLLGGEETEPAPARYLCSHCPASFTLKSNADRHEKTIHLKRKLMQCAYCLKHFRDRTDLHRHLSSVHSKERGHSCPACAKAFSTQKNLATHVKVCCQVGGSSSSALPATLLAGTGGGGDGAPGVEVGSPQAGVTGALWGFRRQIKVENNGGASVED